MDRDDGDRAHLPGSRELAAVAGLGAEQRAADGRVVADAAGGQVAVVPAGDPAGARCWFSLDLIGEASTDGHASYVTVGQLDHLHLCEDLLEVAHAPRELVHLALVLLVGEIVVPSGVVARLEGFGVAVADRLVGGARRDDPPSESLQPAWSEEEFAHLGYRTADNPRF